MKFQYAVVTAALLTLSLAGCVSNDDPSSNEGSSSATTQTHYDVALADDLTLSWAPGTISTIQNNGATDATVDPPFGWLQIATDDEGYGAFSLPEGDVIVPAGSEVVFLPTPQDNAQTFLFNGESVQLQPIIGGTVDPEDELVSGENVWDLSAYQEEHFPHREPGHPDGNYQAAIAYFAEYFEDLGMDVEVDPYGTQGASNAGACSPVGLNSLCADSLANVVATLPGTDPLAPTIFVAGGHFDMVPQTTHAAFDDTSGTVATMELARAMSQFDWRHTLKFGLWGGEENGILGSQFWVQSNPQARATVTSYWNLDVVGMSWPAPLVQPDPLVIAAGPDAPSDTEGGATGPVADSLLGFARELQTTWFGYPTNDAEGNNMWYYEGIASGQANGYAEVNAQSDHTPFMAAGIPAYFIFNGDALAGDNPIGIHNERDTLENMTRYAFFGGERLLEIMTEEIDSDTQYVWDPVEYAVAKDALADSWEVVMWFPFYSTVLQDVGYWNAPGPAGQAEGARAQASP